MIKKWALMLGFCISAWFNLHACDACGCGISSTYWGLIPNYSAGYVSTWYQHQLFRTDLTYLQEDGSTFFSEESFNTIDVRARLPFGKHFFVTALVPYVAHHRTYGQEHTQLRGMGDISLLGTVILLNTRDSLAASLRHRVSLSGGIKLPTGKFRELGSQDIVNPNFQAGTGSYDFLVQAAYTVRYQTFGMQLNAMYKLNTENPDQYQFGNQFNAMANVFWLKAIGYTEWMPSLGVRYEQAEKDIERGFFQRTSGGTLVSAQAGLDVFLNRFQLGFTYVQPLKQNWADGHIENTQRWSLQASYFF